MCLAKTGQKPESWLESSCASRRCRAAALAPPPSLLPCCRVRCYRAATMFAATVALLLYLPPPIAQRLATLPPLHSLSLRRHRCQTVANASPNGRKPSCLDTHRHEAHGPNKAYSHVKAHSNNKARGCDESAAAGEGVGCVGRGRE